MNKLVIISGLLAVLAFEGIWCFSTKSSRVVNHLATQKVQILNSTSGAKNLFEPEATKFDQLIPEIGFVIFGLGELDFLTVNKLSSLPSVVSFALNSNSPAQDQSISSTFSFFGHDIYLKFDSKFLADEMRSPNLPKNFRGFYIEESEQKFAQSATSFLSRFKDAKLMILSNSSRCEANHICTLRSSVPEESLSNVISKLKGATGGDKDWTIALEYSKDSTEKIRKLVNFASWGVIKPEELINLES